MEIINSNRVDELEVKACELRLDVLEMTKLAASGHPSSCFVSTWFLYHDCQPAFHCPPIWSEHLLNHHSYQNPARSSADQNQ